MRLKGWLRDEGDITTGVIWKQLLLFFFPILLGTFFQQLYNTVDAMIVGQGVGKEGLAAVGGTGSIVSLITGFFVGLSSGATVIISQFFGARDDRQVGLAVHTAAAMALLFGVVLTAVGIPLSQTMLRWMQTPADVLPHASVYLRVYFAGMIPSLIYNIGSGVLRAVGDARRPLIFLVVATMTNIVLDLALVIGLKMGVFGAALATVISQTVAAVLVIATLMRSQQSYRLHPRRIRLHGALLGAIVRIGLPAGLQSVMYSVSNVLIQRAVNGFSTDVLAGWTAYNRLDCIFWMVINAFGIAITTFVGQNFGAGLDARVKRGVRVCMGLTAGATVVISAVLLIFGEPVYRLFSNDPAVITEGMKILRFLVPTYLTYISIEILSGALRGAGDTLVPTLMTLFGVCLLRIAWLYLALPRFYSLETVMFSYPMTWTISSVGFWIYYGSGGWLKRAGRRREAMM